MHYRICYMISQMRLISKLLAVLNISLTLNVLDLQFRGAFDVRF